MQKIPVNVWIEKKSGERLIKLQPLSLEILSSDTSLREDAQKIADLCVIKSGYDISLYKKPAFSNDVDKISLAYYLKASPEEKFYASVNIEGSTDVEVTASCIAEAKEKIAEILYKKEEEYKSKGFDVSDWWYRCIYDSQGNKCKV